MQLKMHRVQNAAPLPRGTRDTIGVGLGPGAPWCKISSLALLGCTLIAPSRHAMAAALLISSVLGRGEGGN